MSLDGKAVTPGHNSKKDVSEVIWVFVDTGIPSPGEPPLLKTRVHLRKDAAEQLWKELHRVGRQQVKPCLGSSAEP